MRENKYDSLLNVSIVILIASAVMLAVTGYNIFFKKDPDKSALLSKKEIIRDSLQKVYSNTVRSLDNNLQTVDNSGSKNDPAILPEMNRLKDEISMLLKDKSSEEDLAVAKLKIEELQQKVAQLQNRYTDVESENRRLQFLIGQLVASDKKIATVSTGLNEKTSAPVEKSGFSNNSIIGSLHLFAVTGNNAGEQETTASDEAEKMVGSFLIKNLPARANGEVVVVVLQPDGKVVKNSVWESGTFETKEGKKIYSRKIFFEPAGDEKQLNFSLTPDKFLKGDYTMQIWYNGNMVAKMTKTLS